MNCQKCHYPLTHEHHTTTWDEGDGDVLLPRNQFTCPQCGHVTYDWDDDYEWLPDEYYPKSFQDTTDDGKPVMQRDNALSWSYLIYCLVFDGGIIAGCAYIVFWMGYSGWWFALALFIASCGLQPDKWADLWRPDIERS